jgi:hypothetical protein
MTVRCRVPWPICPGCAEPLVPLEDRATCPLCEESRPLTASCGHPPSVTVRVCGEHEAMCLAHAAATLDMPAGVATIVGEEPPGLAALRAARRALVAGRALTGSTVTLTPTSPATGAYFTAAPCIAGGHGLAGCGGRLRRLIAPVDGLASPVWHGECVRCKARARYTVATNIVSVT